MTKWAVFSMDVEDWYHLAYFDRSQCDTRQSLLDGVEAYASLLDEMKIKSSFFVLGELVSKLKPQLRDLAKAGHEISSHGWDHVRPMTMSVKDFAIDLQRSKSAIEDTLGQRAAGYRAPCFSIDRERLDQIEAAGYTYDSSRIQFSAHPLYGAIEMDGYKRVSNNVFEKDGFVEFQVSTYPVFGRQVPVAGGGYIRLLPWLVMRRLIEAFLEKNELYTLYIHPFETSPAATPATPSSTGWLTRQRFGRGRAAVPERLRMLTQLLKDSGYKFTTFSELQHMVLATDPQNAPVGQNPR